MYIAAIPDVAAMLENGYPDSTVTRDLDSLSSNIPDINVIVISDKNGLRFYHTNRLKTGDSYVAGDEDAILAGSDPYITTGYGTHGMQRRAFHAVKNSSGEIVGFVMPRSAATSRRRRRCSTRETTPSGSRAASARPRPAGRAQQSTRSGSAARGRARRASRRRSDCAENSPSGTRRC